MPRVRLKDVRDAGALMGYNLESSRFPIVESHRHDVRERSFNQIRKNE